MRFMGDGCLTRVLGPGLFLFTATAIEPGQAGVQMTRREEMGAVRLRV